MNPISKKEVLNLQKKNEVYKEIDSDLGGVYVCGGCGQSTCLSHSHLISQGNKMFMADKNNIFIDCMQREISDQFGNLGCHQRTESTDWMKFSSNLDYKKKLDFLKINNPSRFIRIMISKDNYESKSAKSI